MDFTNEFLSRSVTAFSGAHAVTIVPRGAARVVLTPTGP